MVPKDLIRRFVEINGQPGIVTFLGSVPFSVFTLDVVAGKISQIYVVTNPEKLKRLPSLASLVLLIFHSDFSRRLSRILVLAGLRGQASPTILG